MKIIKISSNCIKNCYKIYKLSIFVYFLSKSDLVGQSEMKNSLFIAFRDFLDFLMAINYMPEGWLPWEGRLIHYQIGILGVISSLCRIKQYLFK